MTREMQIEIFKLVQTIVANRLDDKDSDLSLSIVEDYSGRFVSAADDDKFDAFSDEVDAAIAKCFKAAREAVESLKA